MFAVMDLAAANALLCMFSSFLSSFLSFLSFLAFSLSPFPFFSPNHHYFTHQMPII
jgi:hypothetical protein